MAWTAIVFIILALAMIIGPVMMSRPTPHQRRIANLRAQAAQMGLKIHIDRLYEEEIAVYQLLWPVSLKVQYDDVNWCLLKPKHPHEIHFLGHWEWQGRVKPKAAVQTYLEQHLRSLPESVKAVAADQQGIGCFWDESDGEPALLTLKAWLEDARTHLWPRVQRSLAVDESAD